MDISVENMPQIRYTYMHRLALRFCIKKWIKNSYEREALLLRADVHDMDKMVLMLLVPKKAIAEFHRRTSLHHIENGIPKVRLDLLEAIMDYESAGYTKPDKPRNAYDTVRELSADSVYFYDLMHLMEELGMNRSYLNTPENEEWRVFLAEQGEITDWRILRELMKYITDNADTVDSLMITYSDFVDYEM